MENDYFKNAACVYLESDLERKSILPRSHTGIKLSRELGKELMIILNTLEISGKKFYIFYPSKLVKVDKETFIEQQEDYRKQLLLTQGVLCLFAGVQETDKEKILEIKLHGICRGEIIGFDWSNKLVIDNILKKDCKLVKVNIDKSYEDDNDFEKHSNSWSNKSKEFSKFWNDLTTAPTVLDKNISLRLCKLVEKCRCYSNKGLYHLGALADIITSNLFINRENIFDEMAAITSGTERFEKVLGNLKDIIETTKKCNLEDIDTYYLLFYPFKYSEKMREVIGGKTCAIPGESEVCEEGFVCSVCGNIQSKRLFKDFKTVDFCYRCNSLMPGSNLNFIEDVNFMYFPKNAILQRKSNHKYVSLL